MNKIDKQFGKKDLDLIKEIIGNKISKIVHDEFIYTNTSFGHINFFSGNCIYELKCAIYPIDYFGEEEDVAVMNFNKVSIDDVKSELVDGKQIEIKINDILSRVDIINEHQYVKYNNIEYTYDFTKGIILYFNDYEYAFKMSAWFSEIIEVYKGNNLIEKFNNDDDFEEEFKNAEKKEVTRDAIIIN